MEKSEVMVSIIIPVYNAEKTIERCIKSISEIEDLSYEIIVIDDGSQDNSHKIVQQLLKDRKNSIIVTQKNQGPSVARNTGIDYSRGKYIMFVDSDDWIDPKELKRITDIIKTCDYDTIMYNSYFVDKNGNKTARKRFDKQKNIDEHRTLFKVLVTSYEINCIWNNLYNRRIISENSIFFDKNTKNGEDLLFNIKYFEKTKRNIYIDCKLYNHSIDSLGITNTFFMGKFDDLSTTYYERIRIRNLYFNDNDELLKSIKEMYTKVIYRYIALAKINKFPDRAINSKLEDGRLLDITESRRDDSIKYKIIKYFIRKRKFGLIYMMYKIQNVI